VEIFVIGSHASVGIQFWISVLTGFGGIVYWWIRARSEGCPICKGQEYETIVKNIDLQSLMLFVLDLISELGMF